VREEPSELSSQVAVTDVTELQGENAEAMWGLVRINSEPISRQEDKSGILKGRCSIGLGFEREVSPSRHQVQRVAKHTTTPNVESALDRRPMYHPAMS
jgi:hypothetical protein